MEIKEKDLKRQINKHKGETNIFVTIFKILIFVVLIGIQILVYFTLYKATKGISEYAITLFFVIKLFVIAYLLYRNDSLAYKVTWILIIVFLPIAGILLYIFLGSNKLGSKKFKSLRKIDDETEYLSEKDLSCIEEIKDDKLKYNQINYITNVTGYPLYNNENVEYFNLGEKFFDNLKKDLIMAKKYILLEFFMISKGKLWEEILQILKQKSSEGIKITVIYDSIGSLLNRPKNIIQDLVNNNIEVYVFNPFNYCINSYINHRDHRKIIVIDGIVGYTGGINIADEYVNLINKHGHWKDGGIKVVGKCAWSYTLMFLRNLQGLSKNNVNYQWYKDIRDEQLKANKMRNTSESKGYVISFSDGPENMKNPTENVYIELINKAKDYIYINTPYFIVDESLLTALINSARSGVDVRIVLPHIPDKKIVQKVTRSFYEVLLEAGVKIYEYRPGFMHLKSIVIDDEISMISTANLDYRSLHLNYECGSIVYNTGIEKNIREDFMKTLQDCIEIDLDSWKRRNLCSRASDAILSAFAPLL
ncbi:MAG: cardiolipin synthase [Clostridia bacterium]|nr:cardiolipin synthase [Clostridia bacterium]